jgi:V-type H+-transporting ATPase subunit a
MFMSPTSDIAEPLFGHECFTSCDKVTAAICAAHPSIADKDVCGATCKIDGGMDLLTPGGLTTGNATEASPEFKICYSELQSSIQFSLLIAAFVAVPFLLIPIPLIELAEHNKKKKYTALEDGGGEEGGAGGHGEHGEEFSFGDAFIHQAIHTIEFVLGSISNTASYLRLWALSLAHSQLAELFKDMILVQTGLGFKNPYAGAFMAWFCFAAWAVISMIVLMVMENLSSFLHALRLQWVEFQNKFFYGDGRRYAPFAFASINEAGEE